MAPWGAMFVLHSNKDTKILEKSLRVLKSGGQAISLTGPPTPEFAGQIGLPWHLKFVTKLLSSGIKKKAEKAKEEKAKEDKEKAEKAEKEKEKAAEKAKEEKEKLEKQKAEDAKKAEKGK